MKNGIDMKVYELIEQLQKVDQNLEVLMYYDGDARLVCDGAFTIKNFELTDYSVDESFSVYTDALVLCETNDVYNVKDDSRWVWRKK